MWKNRGLPNCNRKNSNHCLLTDPYFWRPMCPTTPTAGLQTLLSINPSLLVLGKVGIHADDELDIGGNAENLLRNVGCAVLLSQREHQPRVDVIAEATTSWTRQACQNRLQLEFMKKNS